jgi:hypothetical protein
VPATDEVIRLIGDVVEATMLASRAFSQGRGLKAPVQKKRRAVAALFRHVAGRKPSDVELEQMGGDTAGVV